MCRRIRGRRSLLNVCANCKAVHTIGQTPNSLTFPLAEGRDEKRRKRPFEPWAQPLGPWVIGRHGRFFQTNFKYKAGPGWGGNIWQSCPIPKLKQNGIGGRFTGKGAIYGGYGLNVFWEKALGGPMPGRGPAAF